MQKGELKPGGVLVLRGCGPKGGPAMAGSASRVVFAIYAAGLENDVAFVSDGQLSGLCNKGLTIAEVSPESAVGGPLSLVENGDRIVIDVDARTLDLDVPETELAARRARRGEPVLATVHRIPVDLSTSRATDVHGRRSGDPRSDAGTGTALSRRFYALPRFEMSRETRGGWMVYDEDGRTLQFQWEMSGSGGQHILLAPVNLNRWTGPADEKIPVAKQLEILAQLRDWLANQQIKSDIERPQSTSSGQRCVWADCTNSRLDGLAHCASHFDMMLLAGD